MQAAPDISVVIPVRGGEACLPALFAALEAQTLPRDRFEVVIVDDRSRDRTRELAAAWAAGDPERRRLVENHGRGPAGARNTGIEHARGAWIAFTDSDVIPYADWVEAIAHAAGAEGAVAFEGFVESWPPFTAGSRTHTVENRDGGRFMTANMAYRRELLESLGGFDEQFRDPFLEDSDLAFRTLDAGHAIPFLPEARVRHPVRTPGALEALRATRRYRWFALLARKHPERYRRQLRPLLRPLTRVDAHILAGLAGAAAAAGGTRRARLVGLALAANGARVLLRTALVGVPAAQRPAHALVAAALPVCKAWWWAEGIVRFAGGPR